MPFSCVGRPSTLPTWVAPPPPLLPFHLARCVQAKRIQRFFRGLKQRRRVRDARRARTRLHHDACKVLLGRWHSRITAHRAHRASLCDAADAARVPLARFAGTGAGTGAGPGAVAGPSTHPAAALARYDAAVRVQRIVRGRLGRLHAQRRRRCLDLVHRFCRVVLARARRRHQEQLHALRQRRRMRRCAESSRRAQLFARGSLVGALLFFFFWGVVCALH